MEVFFKNLQWHGHIKQPFRFKILDAKLVIEELTDYPVELVNERSSPKTLHLDCNFLPFFFCCKHFFCPQVNLKIYVLGFYHIRVACDSPAVREECFSDNLMINVFCHVGFNCVQK